MISYNTTVELVYKNKDEGKWVVTLRQPLQDGREDYWWTETFDAIVVATGHYTVPYIPETPGLAEFSSHFQGSVEHSKAWRGPEKYRGKRVVVVGASISAADMSFALANVVETPLNSCVRGNYHPVNLLLML